MRDPQTEAMELWEEGTKQLLGGDPAAAVETFSRSLSILPTAEAYTFRGWAYSFMNRLDEAIHECEKAIQTDPTFGNPYNDIGCYLMQKGDMEGPIRWFEKAKTASRYEPRHFPYLNMGRLRFARGEMKEALREFQGALREHPDDPMALKFLDAMRSHMD